MIISEENGRIEGVQATSLNKTVQLMVGVPRFDFDGLDRILDSVTLTFPFNKNVPSRMALEDIMWKKVKITVELIER